MILWQCCKENIFISVYTKYRNKNIVVGMFQEKNVSGKCCSNVFTTLSQCWQRFYNVFTTFWQLFMERNVVTTFFRVDKSTLWQHWLWNVAQRFWFPGLLILSFYKCKLVPKTVTLVSEKVGSWHHADTPTVVVNKVN